MIGHACRNPDMRLSLSVDLISICGALNVHIARRLIVDDFGDSLRIWFYTTTYHLSFNHVIMTGFQYVIHLSMLILLYPLDANCF